MKPAPFTYHAPESLRAALRLLDELGDDAAVIAGGQSLMLDMRLRRARPAHVVSLRRFADKLGERWLEERGVRVGAASTLADLQRSDEIAAALPALHAGVDLVAGPSVRSRATIGGNLVNADPAAELPAVCLIMDARLRLRSLDGQRVVPAGEFFRGPQVTARESNELLTEVEVPRRPAGERVAIKEVSRVTGWAPLAGVAVALTPREDDGIANIAVACFGVHPAAIRIAEAEAALESDGYTPAAVATAIEAIDATIEPRSDPYASADYRRAATHALVRRALAETYQGAIPV